MSLHCNEQVNVVSEVFLKSQGINSKGLNQLPLRIKSPFGSGKFVGIHKGIIDQEQSAVKRSDAAIMSEACKRLGQQNSKFGDRVRLEAVA